MKPCVLWEGTVNWAGYGRVSGRGPDGVRRLYSVHRLACEFFHGAPPPGKNEAMHICDVRNCYEPTHLRWGSRVDNALDAKQKGRLATGERSGARTCPEVRPRGERHWKAKLTAGDVSAIRERAKSGEPKAWLAKEYGLAKSHVSRLTLGQSWRHHQ